MKVSKIYPRVGCWFGSFLANQHDEAEDYSEHGSYLYHYLKAKIEIK